MSVVGLLSSPAKFGAMKLVPDSGRGSPKPI